MFTLVKNQTNRFNRLFWKKMLKETLKEWKVLNNLLSDYYLCYQLITG